MGYSMGGNCLLEWVLVVWSSPLLPRISEPLQNDVFGAENSVKKNLTLEIHKSPEHCWLNIKIPSSNLVGNIATLGPESISQTRRDLCKFNI
jgi:hypothetical protein